MEEFKKYIAAVPVREDLALPVQRFMATYFALKNKEEEAKENILATTMQSALVPGTNVKIDLTPVPGLPGDDKDAVVFRGSMDKNQAPEKFQVMSHKEGIEELHKHLEDAETPVEKTGCWGWRRG